MGNDGHAHAVSADTDSRKLAIALVLIAGLMAVEIATGVIAHSLALLSDAGHMLTDAGAIGLSLVAIRLAARPAQGAMTFGLRRVEILSAQANGGTLLVLAGFLAYAAIHRLAHPPDGWRARAVPARPRRRRDRLPCHPPRARGGAARALRHPSHHAAGRPRGRRAADPPGPGGTRMSFDGTRPLADGNAIPMLGLGVWQVEAGRE